MKFQKNLERIMLEKGISSSDLAKKMSTSRQNISRMLKSNRPHHNSKTRLAEALQVSIEDLMKGNSAPEVFSEEATETQTGFSRSKIQHLMQNKQSLTDRIIDAKDECIKTQRETIELLKQVIADLKKKLSE